jgi:flagellin-like hook-associated protein FlgL
LDATTAQTKTKDELDSISSQISTLAKSFSELRFRSDRAEIKTTASHIALGKILDTNMAKEATDLAKNLLVQGMSNKAVIHSKISAKNVFELLI